MECFMPQCVGWRIGSEASPIFFAGFIAAILAILFALSFFSSKDTKH